MMVSLRGARVAISFLWVVVTAAALTVLASADLAEVVPGMAPVKRWALFPLFHETHDVLALGIVLWAAYGLGASVGLGLGFWFFALHIPVLAVHFPEELPDFLRIASVGVVSLFGAVLIRRLRRSEWLSLQREQEVKGHALLSLQVLRERAEALEESLKEQQRLSRLYHTIALTSEARSLIDMGRELLVLIQDEVGAEYASLTLITPEGKLGERLDNFKGLEPFPVVARPGGLGETILRTGATQYISDTYGEPRANPALVTGGIRSYIGLPLKAMGQLAGILFVHSTHPDAFGKDKEFLEAIAAIAAVPLFRATVIEELRKRN